MGSRGLDLSGLGVACCHELSTEPSSSIKCGQFIDELQEALPAAWDSFRLPVTPVFSPIAMRVFHSWILLALSHLKMCVCLSV